MSGLDLSKAKCSIPECESSFQARGLCSAHYAKARRAGEFTPDRRSPEERFWAKVEKTDTCWNWTGGLSEDGYGKVQIDGKQFGTHCISWQMANGREIPSGMQVDHRCHNPACVNPDHLRIVTPGQNKQNLNGAQRNNACGVRGVRWRPHVKKWEVSATKSGKRYYGGRHSTLEEAELAAIQLRLAIHTHNDRDRAKAEEARA